MSEQLEFRFGTKNLTKWLPFRGSNEWWDRYTADWEGDDYNFVMGRVYHRPYGIKEEWNYCIWYKPGRRDNPLINRGCDEKKIGFSTKEEAMAVVDNRLIELGYYISKTATL